MEAVEVGILRASSRRQLKLRIADSLTVSSRLKLGADVTREAVQGRVNSKDGCRGRVVGRGRRSHRQPQAIGGHAIGRVALRSDERPSTPLEPTPQAKFLGTKTYAHARAVGRASFDAAGENSRYKNIRTNTHELLRRHGLSVLVVAINHRCVYLKTAHCRASGQNSLVCVGRSEPG